MTTLLDGNLLVALSIDSHVHHDRAHQWFKTLGKGQFATCSTTQGTLLRLHMRTAADTSALAAWQVLEGVCAHPRHVFWNEASSYLSVPYQKVIGAAQVTDAWLAELARRKKSKLATLDSSLVTVHSDVAFLIPR
jgi:toxin-antitoxin system PIN domain toxin